MARKTNVPHAMKQLIAFEVQAERARRDFKLQENCQEQSKQEPVKEKEKTEKASVKEQVGNYLTFTFLQRGRLILFACHVSEFFRLYKKSMF